MEDCHQEQGLKFSENHIFQKSYFSKIIFFQKSGHDVNRDAHSQSIERKSRRPQTIGQRYPPFARGKEGYM